ncbi:hypothetical protein FoTM2_015421 [Fusarium oxysporum f. sp. vasinfectum]|uniref:Uncharacterized protein n=1 Tax=Fusarium oxysporum f. sp. vasinfectum 25433 TaxID=1089449 RepID=X0LI52_FUSOX|nr:hypothetical protein FOTG_11213 [Fusarium oxysporum f. sp. vasinfectum 25433]KAK2686496.1 hypothetical protein QWA68_014926 [Fusarium oxysporum]KAK2925142.1 hypothetical protein FoTM2_015421 [Fusarium oxysporum f. sp. vasinfectum]
MADLDKRNAKKNSGLIRQGIVQCLTLEAECEALRGSLAESQGHGQKLEARIAEMTADREGLMKILAEKDTLIEKYNALMSETLDRTLRQERQDLRDYEAKVLLAPEQDIDVEMDKKDKKALELEESSDSERGHLQAKRPSLARHGALVPRMQVSQIQSPLTSDRRRPQNGRETVPGLLRQDAQINDSEEDEGLT